MPTVVRREELRKLTGEGAQLVEVLSAADYDWAHLPGAAASRSRSWTPRPGT